MKKQIASILCLALIIVLLTACNRADKTEPTDPHKETQAAAVQTEQPTEITATQIAKEPTAPEATQAINSQTEQTDEATEYEEPTEERSTSLRMTIGDTPVSVAWEDGDAVEALRELCREKPLTIEMSMYGGFEQVGSIGTALPTADRQTTTSPGDIVLYSGDQLVVFYDSNAWAYTPLGHITDQSESELTDLLSNGDTTVTISLE